MDDGPIDPEWLAFWGGLKPALRIQCERGSVAEQIVERYRRRGAATDVWASWAGPIVYVAARQGAARELQQLERRIFEIEAGARQGTRAETGPLNQALGLALGYPACCVDAFVLRHPDTAGDPYYHAARCAWVPAPDYRLNCFLLPERFRLLTYEPCRFDCLSSIRYAARVLELARSRCPGSAARLHRELARSLVIGADGLRAHVELAGEVPTVTRATAPVSWEGRGLRAPEAGASQRWLGARVGRDGRVEVAEGKGIVLDFRSGRSAEP